MILRELFGPSILLEYSRAAVLRQYGMKLAQKTAVFAGPSLKYTPDVVAELAGSILSALESADPTTDKQFSEWIVITYLRGDNPFFPSMLERNLRQRLARFIQLKQQYRHLLPDANINNYKSFDQFIQAIDAVVIPEKSGKNKGTSEEVYRDETVRVIIPRDEAAAVYYGQGTRWCTAYTDPGKNRFTTYKTLFILLPLQPQHPGEKYQLHPSTLETKNETNSNADSSVLITKRFPGLTSDQGQLTLAQQDPGWLSFFKRAGVEISATAATALLGNDPAKAIAHTPKLIAWVRDPSEELQLLAVRKDIRTIGLIKNPTEKVYTIAIEGSPADSLRILGNNNVQIPDPVLAGICSRTPSTLEAVVNNYGASKAVQLAAVKADGNAIRFITVHGEYPSKAVQLAAVKQDGLAIRYIADFREPIALSIQLAAVRQNGTAIQFIENPPMAIEQEAVKTTLAAIEYVRNPSEAMQLECVQKSGNAIQYILNAGIMPSEAVQLAAVRQNGEAIGYIADATTPSEAVQLAAVEQNSNVLEYLIRAGITLSPAVEKLAKRN